MLPGECAGYNPSGQLRCNLCGEWMPYEVLMSAAGYYLGYHCPNCGPYSRETTYFRTKEEAGQALPREGDYKCR